MSKIAVVLGDALFRTTGIMANKTKSRYASYIGKDVAEHIATKGSINAEGLTSIFNKNLGKKTRKFDVIDKRDEIIDRYIKGCNVSREEAEMTAEIAHAIVIPGKDGSNPALGILTENMPQSASANLVSHESEHLINTFFSFSSYIDNFVSKFKLGRKKIEENIKKYGEQTNHSMRILDELLPVISKTENLTGESHVENSMKGFLEYLKINDIKKLKTILRAYIYGMNVLPNGDYKTKKIIASVLELGAKDEARAYRVGGAAEKIYNEAIGKGKNSNATFTQLRAYMYDIASEIMTEEKKDARKNIRRLKLRLKPNNREEKILENYNKIIQLLQKNAQVKQQS